MSIIKRIILLTIMLALVLMMFTSFSRIRVEIYYPQASEVVPIRPLERIEYIPCGKKIITAPYINQLKEYPNGCEAVSTVMALWYMGIDISVDDFIDEYLDMGDVPNLKDSIGPDTDRVYCGDPRSKEGWGCNSSVIVNALNKFIDREKYTVENSYGKKMEELCYDYIDRNIPVIIWVTVNMEDSSAEENYHIWQTEEGKAVRYNRRLHCMLLCGYDSENYYFNDPMTNALKAYPKDVSENAYDILGMQSVAVYCNSSL